jgi:hypothetical protein
LAMITHRIGHVARVPPGAPPCVLPVAAPLRGSRRRRETVARAS